MTFPWPVSPSVYGSLRGVFTVAMLPVVAGRFESACLAWLRFISGALRSYVTNWNTLALRLVVVPANGLHARLG
jgi:hypothetical protein